VPTVKSFIPKTSLSVGYESETSDRAVIKCMVTDTFTQTDAIDAAVASVGSTIYSGTLNIPLLSGDATRFGNGKYIVTLQYGRTARTRRRNQIERRIRVRSVIDHVDGFLVNSSSFQNGYRHSSDPSVQDWYSLQLRPGNLQTPEMFPRPYKMQRPMMRIDIDYTTSFLTVSDAELLKVGKVNSNTFSIPEISGVFADYTLKYESFESVKNDIGSFPWATSLTLIYDPSGHYRQQPQWDQSLDSGNGKWKTQSDQIIYESTVF
jgi:hypothetical protein